MHSARLFTLAAPLAIAVTALPIALQLGMNADNGWLFIAAQRLLENGQYCCQDIIELNPPLATYLTTIPALLHQSLYLSPLLSHTVFTLALFAVSIILTQQFAAIAGVYRQHLAWFLLISSASLLLLPGTTFGQRDHWLILLVFPYLTSVATRSSRMPIPPLLAFAIGVAAGLGFSLKPQTLLIPAALEVLIASRLANWTALCNLYTTAMAAVVTTYIAVLLFSHQAYLDLVPTIIAVYGYVHWSQTYNLILFVLAMLPTLLALRNLREQRPPSLQESGRDLFPRTLRDLANASLLFSVLAFVQGKAWPYYFLPALSLAITAMWSSILTARISPVRFTSATLVTASIVLVLYLPHPRHAAQQAIASFLQAHDATSVASLTSDIAVAHPAALNAGCSYASRFPSLWWHTASLSRPLPALDRNTLATLARWDRYFISDLGHESPEFILYRKDAPSLGHLAQYPGFLDILLRYCHAHNVTDHYFALQRCTN